MILHSSLLWSLGLSDETCWRFPRSLYAVYKTKSVYFFLGRLLFHHSYPCLLLRWFCKFSLRLLFNVDSFLISQDGNTLNVKNKILHFYFKPNNNLCSNFCIRECLKQLYAVRKCQCLSTLKLDFVYTICVHELQIFIKCLC